MKDLLSIVLKPFIKKEVIQIKPGELALTFSKLKSKAGFFHRYTLYLNKPGNKIERGNAVKVEVK